MRELMTISPRSWRWLWIVAGASLSLNILTLVGLFVVRGLLSDVLPAANQHLYNSLQRLDNYEGYEMPVHIQEQVTLSDSDMVLFEDTLVVPVQITVPVSQTIPFRQDINVPINEMIRVQDSVRAPLDINGQRVWVDVPVELDVPVVLDVVAPVDAMVPIQLDIPLDFELSVPVRELIPLQNQDGEPLTIGLDLQTTVPVPMDSLMQDVEMLPMLAELHKALNLLESLLLLPLPR